MPSQEPKDIEERRIQLTETEREAQERLADARAALRAFNEAHPPETVVGH